MDSSGSFRGYVGAGMGHYWFNRDLKTAATLGEDDAGLGCHL